MTKEAEQSSHGGTIGLLTASSTFVGIKMVVAIPSGVSLQDFGILEALPDGVFEGLLVIGTGFFLAFAVAAERLMIIDGQDTGCIRSHGVFTARTFDGTRKYRFPVGWHWHDPPLRVKRFPGVAFAGGDQAGVMIRRPSPVATR